MTTSALLLRAAFDNQLLRRLPVDAEAANQVRRVRGACFSRVLPTPLAEPRLVAFSESALRLLDVDDVRAAAGDARFVAAVAGNAVLPGSDPAAHCYAGHQFGSFAGQLGDGRAISLGEVVNARGERWEMQLKGAGRTPYSRSGDGRAVLRSSIREFACSEFMHAAGIPTTRAATLVVSSTKAMRDPMYDGNPIAENCAVVMRLAPTFFRFGSWEIFKPADAMSEGGPSAGVEQLGIDMADAVIDLHFPELATLGADKYAAFFKTVVERSARLVADWQLVGFTHGVLNTDNMSVLGLSIDYGPFGFLDWYNPRFVPNTTDEGGRYRYEAQPDVFQWNLRKFAEALSAAKVLPLDKGKELIAAHFADTYQQHYLSKLRSKLGLRSATEDADEQLFVDFLNAMELTGSDFTNTFRSLAMLKLSQPTSAAELVERLVSQGCAVSDLQRMVRPMYTRKQLEILRQLKQQDPRTFAVYTQGQDDMVEVELEKWDRFDELAKMSDEEKRERDRTIWSAWVAQYEGRLRRELAAAASAQPAAEFDETRAASMNAANPKFVPRNYLLQEAIDAADADDFAPLHRLMRVLTAPFDEHADLAEHALDGKRPAKYCDFLLSCSS